ncbi:MAG: TetR/AcrR family transcriptional regulator [Archangium sp.]
MRNAAGQKKRQRLLDAALRVFEERGFSHSKIEDIAGVAEVARTSFYFYFPTKDDVLALLLEEAEAAILSQWKPVPGAMLVETLASFEGQLAAHWGGSQRRHLLPDVFRVQVKRCEGFVTTRCAYTELLMPVFADALRRGEVGTALPVDQLAGTYLRTCFATLGRSMSERDVPLETLLARSTSLLLRGCAA